MADDSEPVVIGGVGGSGTRLPAYLLQELGFYMGDELNEELDNLWFGFLLGGRPELYWTEPEQISAALRTFEETMRGNWSLEPEDSPVVAAAIRYWSRRASKRDGQAVRELLAERARTMVESSGPPGDAAGWGWKNPNAHVYLRHLAEAFPLMRYVHVIRDGLELAGKAKVLAQVRDWGPLFRIESPPDSDGRANANATLRYWIRANGRALDLGAKLFGRRMLVVRYESLCSDPEAAVGEIADFLGVRPVAEVAAKFSALVAPSPATGRDASCNVGRFGAEELAGAEALGYPTVR